MFRYFFLLCLVSLSYQERTSYSGYQVIETEKITSKLKIMNLIEFVETCSDYDAYDFWIQPRTLHQSATIMVKPGWMDKLEIFLNEESVSFKILIQDVEEINQREMERIRRIPTNGEFDWKEYRGVDEINGFMKKLAKEHKDVEVVTIGKSYEGRRMKALKISKAGKDAPNIWIEAGIHAREWIAPAMATYLMNNLLKEGTNYTEKLNIYILPSANPDGYEFSRNEKRFWRKTRSRNFFSPCRGVDPNRNWDFHWHESGVSDNPCTDVFAGRKAFSERETRNIRDFVQTLEPVPVLSICLHSAANLWLYPYGYAYDAYPENVKEIKELAIDAVDALNAVHGSGFEAINSAELSSDDWYKGVLGSRFAYTVELRKGGSLGFDLPPEQIVPSGEELWAAFQVLFERMIAVSY